MINYFEIENLNCSYDKKRTILEINKLEIPVGKLVFIVGQSGCGKSTIMETLGLMNNTIFHDGENKIKKGKFDFFAEDKRIDCLDIWNKSNKEISAIRKKYFSFIFQQTNLMKNFSIRENAELSQQIKGGSKKYTQTLMQVNLDEILTQNKQFVGELSGGQQQRLAFVRAFMPNFNILFGDEPTGNLDPENADNLMKIIKDEIQNSRGVKTAIIVSHTPELYNKYADIIITIHKKERDTGKQDKNGNPIRETYGLIDAQSVAINHTNHAIISSDDERI